MWHNLHQSLVDLGGVVGRPRLGGWLAYDFWCIVVQLLAALQEPLHGEDMLASAFPLIEVQAGAVGAVLQVDQVGAVVACDGTL